MAFKYSKTNKVSSPKAKSLSLNFNCKSLIISFLNSLHQGLVNTTLSIYLGNISLKSDGVTHSIYGSRESAAQLHEKTIKSIFLLIYLEQSYYKKVKCGKI